MTLSNPDRKRGTEALNRWRTRYEQVAASGDPARQLAAATDWLRALCALARDTWPGNDEFAEQAMFYAAANMAISATELAGVIAETLASGGELPEVRYVLAEQFR